MVSLNIHAIHADNRVTSAPYLNVKQANYPLSAIIKRYPNFSEIVLTQRLNRSVIQISLSENPYKAIVVDAQTGETLPPLTIEQVKTIALSRVIDKAPIVQIQRLKATPSYVSGRYTSLYEVTFDTFDALTFYIHDTTGEIVSKRHSLWHVFDWMWRFHITDYDDGENVHNRFLQVLSLLSLMSVLLGLCLLYCRRRFIRQVIIKPQALYKQALSLHKWLALLVSVQIVIWLMSGAYLSLIKKPFIAPLPIAQVDWSKAVSSDINFADALTGSNAIIAAKLHNAFGQPFILYTEDQGYHRNFASTKHLIKLNEMKPYQLEKSFIEDYLTKQKITFDEVHKLASGQSEIRGEINPVWSIHDAVQGIHYYFDARTGEPVAKYDTLMPVYDFMLRLHFMDYFSCGHFNHIWNIILAAGFLLLSVTGLLFCYRRIRLQYNYRQR